MEKIFSFNKWFILFCALLIVTWGTLKVVSDMTICEEANYLARTMFAWEWPDLKANATVDSIRTKVIQHTANDAVVEVSGNQIVTTKDTTPGATKGATTNGTFLANLSFYKQQNKWILGKVELK